MGCLGGLLVVLAAWLLGRALLPCRRSLPRDPWEEQAAALLLGSAAWMTAGMLLLAAGLPFTRPVVLLLLAAGLALGLRRVLRERQDRALLLAPALLGWQRYLVWGLGLASVVATLLLPLNAFDPIFHFAAKGKVLFYSGDGLDPAFTAVQGEVGRIMTHPNYPLGIPILEALAAHAGGAWSDRWVQWPLAFWAAALPAAVSLGLRAVSTRAAAWGALLAAATPILYVRNFLRGGTRDLARAGLGGDVSLGGGADLPLAALLTLACALLLRAREQPARRRVALLAGLALAGAVQVKNEALGLTAVLFLALAAGDPRGLLDGARRRVLLLALAATALAAAPWLVHRSRLPAIDENYGARLRPAAVLQAWTMDEPKERTPMAMAGLLEPDNPDYREKRRDILLRYYRWEFTDLFSWGLLWLAVLLALPLGRRFRDADARWLTLLLLGGLILYALVLLVPPWALTHLRQTGIPDRLFLHLLGPAALLAGGALAREPGTVGEHR